MEVVVGDRQIILAHLLDSVVLLFALELLLVENVVICGADLLRVVHLSIHVGHLFIHVDDFIFVLSSSIHIVNYLHLVHVDYSTLLASIGWPSLVPIIIERYLLDRTSRRLYICYPLLAWDALCDQELLLSWELSI